MRIIVRAPGVYSSESQHLVERGGVDAREQRHPAPAATPRSRARRASPDSVIAGDLVLAAGVGGEHLDDLALDQRGVDVHHDEALGVAQDAALLDRDVDAVLVRPTAAQVGLQDVGVGARDLQPQRGDGVAGQAQDAVDVAAGVGDPLGEGGHRGRAQRVAEDDDLRAADAARPVVAGAVLDLDLEAERRRRRSRTVGLERRDVVRAR